MSDVAISPAPCRCGKCIPARRFCWSCSVESCRRGPFSYDPKDKELPIFTRPIMTPGVLTGKLLEFCSLACWGELDKVRRADLAALAPAVPSTPQATEERLLDLEKIEVMLRPAARQRVAEIALGRMQSVPQVLVGILDDLDAAGQLDVPPIVDRPPGTNVRLMELDIKRMDRDLKRAAEPAPTPDPADDLARALPKPRVLAITQAHMEDFARQRRQSLEEYAADLVEWSERL